MQGVIRVEEEMLHKVEILLHDNRMLRHQYVEKLLEMEADEEADEYELDAGLKTDIAQLEKLLELSDEDFARFVAKTRSERGTALEANAAATAPPIGWSDQVTTGDNESLRKLSAERDELKAFARDMLAEKTLMGEELRDTKNENASLRSHVQQLTAELQTKSLEAASVNQYKVEIAELTAELQRRQNGGCNERMQDADRQDLLRKNAELLHIVADLQDQLVVERARVERLQAHKAELTPTSKSFITGTMLDHPLPPSQAMERKGEIDDMMKSFAPQPGSYQEEEAALWGSAFRNAPMVTGMTPYVVSAPAAPGFQFDRDARDDVKFSLSDSAPGAHYNPVQRVRAEQVKKEGLERWRQWDSTARQEEAEYVKMLSDLEHSWSSSHVQSRPKAQRHLDLTASNFVRFPEAVRQAEEQRMRSEMENKYALSAITRVGPPVFGAYKTS